MTTNTLLKQYLDSQLELIILVEDILVTELKALTSKNSSDLDEILKKKLETLDNIQILDKQISELFKSTNNKESLLEEIFPIKKLIDNKLVKIKQKNLVNEKVVQQNLITLSQLKGLLFKQSDHAPVTYSQQGKNQFGSNSRSIKA